MSAIVTRHANLCIATQSLSSFTGIAVVLPQMNTVCSQTFRKANAIIDDERRIMICANTLEWRGEPSNLMIVNALQSQLKRRNRRSR